MNHSLAFHNSKYTKAITIPSLLAITTYKQIHLAILSTIRIYDFECVTIQIYFIIHYNHILSTPGYPYNNHSSHTHHKNSNLSQTQPNFCNSFKTASTCPFTFTFLQIATIFPSGLIINVLLITPI